MKSKFNLLSKVSLLFVLVALFSIVAIAEAVPDLEKYEYEKKKRMDEVSREMAKTANQEMVFYGHVIDFDGAPVAGAEIKISVRVFGAKTAAGNFKRLTVSTDEHGFFALETFGELITIENISKEGYFYHFRYNPKRSLKTAIKEKRKGVGYEPDKPMVLRMRKLNPPDFVFTTGMSFVLKPGEAELLDLYQQKWVDPEDLVAFRMTDKLWHPDIRASLEKDGEGFRVIIEALDADSGLVTQDVAFIEEMAEAPVDGYVPRLVLPVQRGGGGSLFAYVKCAGGLFYSRVRLQYSVNEGRDSVYLEWAYQTNATGGRGLEYADDLYQEYLDEISVRSRVKLQRDVLQRGEQVVLPRPRTKP